MKCTSNNGNAGAAHSAEQPPRIEWPGLRCLDVDRQRRVHTLSFTGCGVSMATATAVVVVVVGVERDERWEMRVESSLGKGTGQ